MSAIKQCFSWWCFSNRGVADNDLLYRIKLMGYSGVEMIDQNLWPVAHNHGLELVSMNGHASIESGLNDPANHPRILDELRRNLELASKNNVRSLIAFSGSRRDGLSEADGIKYTSDALAKVAPDAESAGVDINIELLNSKVDHPGYQCDHTSFARTVVEQVGSPRIKVLYDIYHMQIMEGDLIRTIHDNRKVIGHYHTAGNPGRHEMDSNQEINYPAVYQAILSTGYSGYIGHEFIPNGEPVSALKDAFEQCKNSLI